MAPRVLFRAWLLCVCASWLPRAALAGPLQDVEDAASKPSRDEERGSPGSARDTSDDGTNVELDGERRAPFARHLVLFPWTLPRLLIDDPCLSAYALYPYRDGHGPLRAPATRPECARSSALSAQARVFALHSDFETGYMLQGLWAGTFAARLALPERIEIEGRISFMRELATPRPDQALAGTTHLSYRFAQSQSVVLRTGVGMRAFSLNRPLFGIDVLYGMDLYARKPLIVHLELHAGSLGSAFLGQVRAAIGVQLWKLELYAGYDHTVVMGERKTKLGGPVVGARAWF